MENNQPGERPKIIDTNNFWMLFSSQLSANAQRVMTRKKESIGNPWQIYVSDHAELYEQTTAVVARYDREYSPDIGRVIDLLNDFKREEAEMLRQQVSERHRALLEEMHIKLTESYYVLESLGADTDNLCS